MATSRKNKPTPTKTFPNTPAGTKAAFEHGQKYGEKQVEVGPGIETGFGAKVKPVKRGAAINRPTK